MVGINTVLVDNPQLTARDSQGIALDRQPLRVIVDSTARTPAAARLLSELCRALTAISQVNKVASRRLADLGVEVEAVPASDGSVDLCRLLEALAGREVSSVLVEGGGTLLGSLFDKGLIDKYVAFIAPTIIGSVEAPSPIGGRGIEDIKEALRLQHVTIQQMGKDVMIAGYSESK